MSAIQVDATVYLAENEAVTTIYDTGAIDVQQIELFSFDVSWQGGTSITGTVDLQVSNDKDGNFVAVDGSTNRIGDDNGKHIYNVTNMGYRYMKLVINLTAGNSNFDIIFNSRSRRS